MFSTKARVESQKFLECRRTRFSTSVSAAKVQLLLDHQALRKISKHTCRIFPSIGYGIIAGWLGPYRSVATALPVSHTDDSSQILRPLHEALNLSQDILPRFSFTPLGFYISAPEACGDLRLPMVPFIAGQETLILIKPLSGGETFMRERVFVFGENRKWTELVDFKRVSHQVPLNAVEVHRAWHRLWRYSYEEAWKQRREMMKESEGLNPRHHVKSGIQTGECA